MIGIPGFGAVYSIPSRVNGYPTQMHGTATGDPNTFVPQAIGIGGFGGGFGGGGTHLDPRPSSCSQCQWTCSTVSCGPGCIREECRDVCTSVPCFMF
jgi:hypothetical protein